MGGGMEGKAETPAKKRATKHAKMAGGRQAVASAACAGGTPGVQERENNRSEKARLHRQQLEEQLFDLQDTREGMEIIGGDVAAVDDEIAATFAQLEEMSD